MRQVARAVKNKELPVLDGSISCLDCGSPATCYDHRDYAKPLDVDPVCHGCNLRRGAAHPFRRSGDVGTEPRNNITKVRFSKRELELVKAAAKKIGVPVAVLARQVAQGHIEKYSAILE